MKQRFEFKKLVCLLCLAAADLIASAGSFGIAFLARQQILLRGLHLKFRSLTLSGQIQTGFVVFAGATILLIFAFEKLYVKRYAFWEEARHLFRALSLAFILMVMVALIPGTFPHFSRTVLVLAWLISFFLFPAFRLLVKKMFRKTGLWKKNVLILGTNPMAWRVAEEIVKNDTLCYEIAGFLSEDPSPSEQPGFEGVKIVGTLDQLSQGLCLALDVRDIFIALTNFPEKELIRIAKLCEGIAETIKIVPDISTLYTLGVEVENVGDIISVSITRNLAKPWNILVKHAYELGLAFVMLILLAPVFAGVALAIRLDSSGPVFFKQFRLGKKNKIFTMVKFRSMFVDNQQRLELHFHAHPEARQEWSKFRKLKNGDPRVTRVGRLIRSWSLDELPQILNVIRGDMSLVGPRPYLPVERGRRGDLSMMITSVRPGMTGLWQIRGRSLLSFEDRVYLDDFYIRNWSLWLDIVILLKTIKVIFSRKGAY